MACVEMEYILIRKSDEINVEQTFKDCILKKGFIFDNNTIVSQNGNRIGFTIDHKETSNRYYLIISTNSRINIASKELQCLDDALIKTDINKYINVVRTYDGLSSKLSEKLYPQYAVFERKLRQLILLVLTKAFGENWVNETVTESIEAETKKKARGGNLTTNDFLELLDLSQLENYLFAETEKDYKELLKNDFCEEKVKMMSAQELRDSIEKMRPSSLWNRVFSDLGSAEEWRKRIKDIRGCRNSVAHHKRITYEQYKDTNKKLKELIVDIESDIEQIQNRDFTEENSIDVLSGFVLAMSKVAKEIVEQYDFSVLAIRFSEITDRMMMPVSDEIVKNLKGFVSDACSSMKLLSEEIRIKPEYENAMKRVAKANGEYSVNFENSIAKVLGQENTDGNSHSDCDG